MTPTELQALRRLLGYSPPEAARRVAADPERPQGVEERTWQRWERGERPPPPNIAQRVRELVAWRTLALADGRQLIEQQLRAAAGPVRLLWYDQADDWPEAAALWRPAQTVAAQLLAEHEPGAVALVPFDAGAFRAWRQRAGLTAEPDGPALRARWAAASPPGA